MKKLVVVGSLNMDLVSRVEVMPREGETVTAISFLMQPGGKGANQAVAAGRLGGNVDMIGVVGDDAFAEQLVRSLAGANVGSAGIRRVAGSSGCATVLVSANGSNCIAVAPGANARLQPDDLDREVARIAEAAVVLCQLETPLNTVVHLSKLAAQCGCVLVLDPAPAQPALLPQELLQRVTWLTPNETETLTLLSQLGRTGTNLATDAGIEHAAAILLDAGPANVILKRGSKGIYMAGRDCTACHIAAPLVAAVDSTAAGDAFNGGFAYALAKGHTANDAAEFACRVAAYSVTVQGAQDSLPWLKDLQAFETRI